MFSSQKRLGKQNHVTPEFLNSSPLKKHGELEDEFPFGFRPTFSGAKPKRKTQPSSPQRAVPTVVLEES